MVFVYAGCFWVVFLLIIDRKEFKREINILKKQVAEERVYKSALEKRLTAFIVPKTSVLKWTTPQEKLPTEGRSVEIKCNGKNRAVGFFIDGVWRITSSVFPDVEITAWRYLID